MQKRPNEDEMDPEPGPSSSQGPASLPRTPIPTNPQEIRSHKRKKLSSGTQCSPPNMDRGTQATARTTETGTQATAKTNHIGTQTAMEIQLDSG